MTSGITKEKDFLVVAQITAHSGDSGFLKLKLFTDFTEKFRSLKSVFVDFFGKMKELQVEEIKGGNESLLIKLRSFDSKNETNILINKFIYIPESQQALLPEGTFFIHDYIGSQVFKNGTLFGVVKDFYSLKSNNVFVIRRNDGSEYLVPAIADYIDNFESAEKKLFLRDGEEFYDED